jgi:hypothetical protein
MRFLYKAGRALSVMAKETLPAYLFLPENPVIKLVDISG